MNEILKRAKEIENELISIRRTIHKNPEIGFELDNTLKLVADTLCSYGYSPKNVGKAGITAVAGNGKGKTILLRADMDALPMKENTGLSFASNNGYMHACGHDIHTTALLGAAKILKEKENEINGTVKFMFQPCEERMMGAHDMVKAGILENPHVDAAFALHVANAKLLTAGYSKGYACASSDTFKIIVKGKGGHGAAPHMNIDPINIISHINIALQAINSREVHPDKMLVLTVCMVNSGFAPNITPETAEISGTIRTMDNNVREFAKKRLVEISKGISNTFRASCEVIFESEGIPPMLNNDKLLNDISMYIDDMLGSGTCYELERMTGSEDFSVISQMVPSVLMWFGTGSKEEGYLHGVHDSCVTFNEKAICSMSAVYAQTAIKWLCDN